MDRPDPLCVGRLTSGGLRPHGAVEVLIFLRAGGILRLPGIFRGSIRAQALPHLMKIVRFSHFL